MDLVTPVDGGRDHRPGLSSRPLPTFESRCPAHRPRPTSEWIPMATVREQDIKTQAPANRNGVTGTVETTPVVAVKRRTIDSVLVGFGIVATLVLALSGALLIWGSNFA